MQKNTTSTLQASDAGIICNLKAKYRKRLVRHVVSLLNQETAVSTFIKQITVLDTIRLLKSSWDEVNKSANYNCFKKCGFSEVKSMKGEAPDDAEFQDLFQLLTNKVDAEGHLSIDHDVETHGEALNTTQVDWRETARERCIQELTNDIVENQMELD